MVSRSAEVLSGVSGSAPTKYKSNRPVDLTHIPTVPWALLDEHEAAAVMGFSVSFLRCLRHRNEGPRFLKVGRNVRYRLADVQSFLAGQPTAGGATVEPVEESSAKRRKRTKKK